MWWRISRNGRRWRSTGRIRAACCGTFIARGSGEKVLIFSDMKSQGQFLWEADRSDFIQQRQLPAGNDGVWFLPQPVSGGFFPNPRSDGNLSRRSEEAVTAFRYAVLESDEADADDWLRCLVQMPLRIACICESGNRSIHALVRLDAASKADWDRLMAPLKPVLITLGADRGALSAVRLSRLPQAMRGERCQRLLYLNPQPNGVPIVEQPNPPALYSQKVGTPLTSTVSETNASAVATWADANGIATEPTVTLLPPPAGRRLGELVAHETGDPAELRSSRC